MLNDAFVLTTGGARRARRIAKYLNMKIALIESRLENENPVANVVGTIEENAVVVDDMIDTGHIFDFSCLYISK
jgi:phosphoribosylpyrophosphate synthetase